MLTSLVEFSFTLFNKFVSFPTHLRHKQPVVAVYQLPSRCTGSSHRGAARARHLTDSPRLRLPVALAVTRDHVAAFLPTKYEQKR